MAWAGVAAGVQGCLYWRDEAGETSRTFGLVSLVPFPDAYAAYHLPPTFMPRFVIRGAR